MPSLFLRLSEEYKAQLNKIRKVFKTMGEKYVFDEKDYLVLVRKEKWKKKKKSKKSHTSI